MNKYTQSSIKKRTGTVTGKIVLAAVAVCVVAFAIYAGQNYFTKFFGKTLTPSGDFEVHGVEYYLQNDPEWSDDVIGGSGRRMGGTGCLVTCIASAITDLGVPVTPKEVNERLGAVGGYQGADVIWYKINEAFPEIDYKYSRVFSSETIESDLESGLLPIVNVKYKRGGVTHWLLVVGAEGGEFLVYDPLNAEKAPIGLSVHGRVYAYRVLVPAR